MGVGQRRAQGTGILADGDDHVGLLREQRSGTLRDLLRIEIRIADDDFIPEQSGDALSRHQNTVARCRLRREQHDTDLLLFRQSDRRAVTFGIRRTSRGRFLLLFRRDPSKPTRPLLPHEPL